MTERNTILENINGVLIARKLKPLSKLGQSSMGEIEILALHEVFDHSSRFFTDVKFAVRFPNGSEGFFTVRFNANGQVSDGAVIVVLINGKFAIVKQWRLPLGRWTYEVPRGFGDSLESAQSKGLLATLKFADLPLATLARELGQELMDTAEVSSVTHLGTIAENSGTSAIAPSFFLVQLKTDPIPEKQKGNEDRLSVELWDPAELRSELGCKLCDNHSITPLALALNYIDKKPC